MCDSWCWVILYTGANVNECATNNGGCAHICTDTEGSFTCSCNSGFELASNGLSCNGEEGSEGGWNPGTKPSQHIYTSVQNAGGIFHSELIFQCEDNVMMVSYVNVVLATENCCAL